MIRGRRKWGVRWCLLMMWQLVLLCCAGLPLRAEGVVDLAPNIQVLDLATHGTRVAAQRRNLKLEVPGVTDGTRAVLELRGQGLGPEFNWTVYTLRNVGPEPRDVVISVDNQSLAASGFLALKPFGSQLVSMQWLEVEPSPTRQNAASGDAVRFQLKPNTSMTFGLEGNANLQAVRAYDAQAFSQREASLAFLRGAVLAVSFVLALSMLSLYGIRASPAFLVGGLFGFAALAFMALETGYAKQLTVIASRVDFNEQQLRAVCETLLALGASLCLWGLTNLNRRSWLRDAPFILVIVGLLVLLGYAVFMPLHATLIARVALCACAFAGFTLTFLARRRGTDMMDSAMLFWSLFAAWALLAAMSALGESTAQIWHALLLTGLAAVLCILAFALLRLAFAQGYLSKPFLTDASRRSLALTGAQHFLWDWQPQENLLDIGTDLARGLGHAIPAATAASATRWFAALVHPADDIAYRKCLDLRPLKAGSFVEQDLRLRDASGAYHWFTLRARALPGAGGVPARLIGTLTDITRNKQSEDRLINESIHDPITGLPSRALFLDRLEREVAKPLGLPRRVLMIGIERFKILNDGLGHDLGDQLLLVIGQRVTEMLGPEETVARISGSQFAVMHVETIDGRSAESLAQNILDALAQSISMLSQDVYLAACVGISQSSEQGLDATELQQQAETALQEAQSLGPRNIVTHHADIADDRAEKVALETDLRRAIDRSEIEVHYQPIMYLLTRDVAGFEALARWRHPTRGLLAPSEFIGLAEQAGMIGEIGDLVLSEAIRQMGIWERVLTRNRPVFMAINVSADQLSDIRFMDRVSMLVAREGVLPQSIKIEITESVVMRYPERARQMITKLRNLGIGVACDDFGTGFSNLASLRELSFDTLKMDRTFITSGGLDGRGSVILQSVVDLAHSLGMSVVAEGIETETQAEHLLMLGCELGQGYLLGPPMAAREIYSILSVLPVITSQQQAPALEAPQNYEDDYIEPEELPSLRAVNAPPKRAKKKAKKPARKTTKTKTKARKK
jgi:diguanylate cyclase (GGDEF)-like protein